MTLGTTTSAEAPRLKRSLSLWDLILYGIIVIQPVAPMSVFGVLSDSGHGHVCLLYTSPSPRDTR